jgi:erythronate-4-phosphate dehydrogenase
MTTPINIVAGENIPYVHEAFAGLGNLTVLPGRSMTAGDLKDANVLLIRSITRVDETLLEGTPVEFVGSASAGVDHIDEDYLKARKIGFASATGSNANSVAEYVMAALLLLAARDGFSLSGKTIGIVGVGHIGRRVKIKAEALGMHPVLHDPPLAEAGRIAHHSLEDTLGCDIITLHTPFTDDGPYPTYHMLNTHTFKWVKPTAIFINAARGEVVNTQALLDVITRKRIGPTIIDVWEHEPDINWDLVQAVMFGTPHIAGHSLDGKANGTFMIYTALCKHLGRDPLWNPARSLPPPIVPSIEIDPRELSEEEMAEECLTGKVVKKMYNLQVDDRRLRELLSTPPEQRPVFFDRLRKEYPIRREFHTTTLHLPKNMNRLRKMFTGIGFSNIQENS